jgi:hypothetical protein
MLKKTTTANARMTNTLRTTGRLFPRRRRFVAVDDVADIWMRALNLFPFVLKLWMGDH